jgi:hypothetical protein
MKYKTVIILVSVFILFTSMVMFMLASSLSLAGIHTAFLLALIANVIFVWIGSSIECQVSLNGDKKLIPFVAINSLISLLGVALGIFACAVLVFTAVLP